MPADSDKGRRDTYPNFRCKQGRDAKVEFDPGTSRSILFRHPRVNLVYCFFRDSLIAADSHTP